MSPKDLQELRDLGKRLDNLTEGEAAEDSSPPAAVVVGVRQQHGKQPSV